MKKFLFLFSMLFIIMISSNSVKALEPTHIEKTNNMNLDYRRY